MTDERWDRLDALAAAATPGAWTTHGAFIDAPGGNIAETYTTNFDAPDPYADAAFIAACDPATIRDLVAAAREREAAIAERDALAEDEQSAVRERDELRAALDDHIPSGGEDMTGYGYVSCSCGWMSDATGGPHVGLGWAEHILAASPAPEPDVDEAGLPITHDAHSRDWFEGYAAGRAERCAMPDVTPKTESAKLLDLLHDVIPPDEYGNGIDWKGRIERVQEEAASKAVAEVLEIDQLVLAEALWNIYGPKFPNSTAEDWKSDASYLAALIASERTP